MNCHSFSFGGAELAAMGSGALWWPEQSVLCVSDLHLGKSDRIARLSGQSLPPYETQDTLARLADDLAQTNARQVICLGDSFDDIQAAGSLTDAQLIWIAKMQAGRRWIWIEGNHDPGPVAVGGEHRKELVLENLTFRHIAMAGAANEVSGHFHPKARLPTRGRTISRPAFLVDHQKLILPAYGTYTGGLLSEDPVLSELMGKEALAILTGPVPTCVPMPR